MPRTKFTKEKRTQRLEELQNDILEAKKTGDKKEIRKKQVLLYVYRNYWGLSKKIATKSTITKGEQNKVGS